MSARIVSEIWIYPIKSLGGIRLPAAQVCLKGLENDRRLMLIDEANQCMTQREFPQMALFKTELRNNQLLIHFSGESIELDSNYSEEPINSKIFDDDVVVHEVSKAHSGWLSARLKTNCRLVVFPEDLPRPIDPRYKVNDDHVSLADAYPLLIVGQRSLDDLNSRLEKPLPIHRFRPNLVFTGGEAFEEDSWSQFTIGETIFAAVKSCARCAITTINQETAEKGLEPLVTLAKFRNENNKVLFGQNLIPLNAGGIVSVGDKIEVLTFK